MPVSIHMLTFIFSEHNRGAVFCHLEIITAFQIFSHLNFPTYCHIFTLEVKLITTEMHGSDALFRFKSCMECKTLHDSKSLVLHLVLFLAHSFLQYPRHKMLQNINREHMHIVSQVMLRHRLGGEETRLQ